MKNNKSTIQSEHGVILITTLWILLILSVVALGFSIELQLEARLARYHLDSHTAYYLARAGIERAMVELKNDMILDRKARPQVIDSLADSWAMTEDTRDIFENVELGEGTYSVRVVDEYGKLNINRANQRMLQGLFMAMNFSQEDSNILSISIIDFRDQDDWYMRDTSISELEFYFGVEELEEGEIYFKNAEFISPDELLLIPGITPEMLYIPRPVYGYRDMEIALIDLLTVHGAGLININTAELPVITAAIISIGEEDPDNAVSLAERIIRKRNGSDDIPGTTDDQPYANIAELSNELDALNPVLVSRLYAAMRTTSDLYNITAIGEVTRAKKQVQALVQREWVVKALTEEEMRLFELQNTGIKEGVRLQVNRWIEF